jgi:hypothetical protein
VQVREKKDQLIITFSTTTEAIKMEKYCLLTGIAGRIIPVPREISAGCGLAWKTEVQLEKDLKNILQAAGITWENMTIVNI